ncbi:hypothetical protein M0R89_07905 [Halorussus limi]|uniref:Uncharacterized protein n=1 Tax=Halorussus limi TaxID=2938695 RepID=A0A8U0HXU6_9EURY|nr:hypothetical protein [Halorussus limi]UPV75972.1 hypothetical protein M0R89_07905 [Halorussus limi]
MAPLDWLTPERVSAFLDRFGALAFLGLGVLSLYQGLTGPQTDVYFGADAFVWVGIGWILSGLYFWFSRHYSKGLSES